MLIRGLTIYPTDLGACINELYFFFFNGVGQKYFVAIGAFFEFYDVGWGFSARGVAIIKGTCI